jgi:hypothetical protein
MASTLELLPKPPQPLFPQHQTIERILRMKKVNIFENPRG